MVVSCTTHVLLFFSSLTFSLFLLHSHLSSSVIVDMFVYGRGATKQERCRVRFRSPQLVVDLYRPSKPSLNHSRDPWRNPSFLADQVNSFIVDSLLVFPYWLRIRVLQLVTTHRGEVLLKGEVMGSRLTNNLIMESERTHNEEVWVSALQDFPILSSLVCPSLLFPKGQGLIQRLMGLYAEQRLWEPRPVERADDERLIDHGFDPLLPMNFLVPWESKALLQNSGCLSTDVGTSTSIDCLVGWRDLSLKLLSMQPAAMSAISFRDTFSICPSIALAWPSGSLKIPNSSGVRYSLLNLSLSLTVVFGLERMSIDVEGFMSIDGRCALSIGCLYRVLPQAVSDRC
ncbi:hypothetical protein F2Q70_00012015 [Brassica cretica]|uniref:Uncharacterized protein n=1 Tax=Brassica cretica TaxID=69181 RepID=A0A8S9M1F2_BRACR|nr:hypothetical protein F2Q70_00012015 [Brassica cretica]